MWEAQYFKHEAPRSLVTSGGLGTMGFALPAAIGAKFACPEKDVWVIAGDGGFQMTAAELSTIVQEGSRNQHRRHQQRLPRHGPPVAGGLLRQELLRLAHPVARLRHARRRPRHRRRHRLQRPDVTPTVTRARTSGTAFLINFQVEKEDGVYPMIAPGAALHEMVRRPQANPLLETAEDE